MYAQKTLAALMVAVSVVLATTTGCVQNSVLGGVSTTRPTNPTVAVNLPPRQKGQKLENIQANFKLYEVCEKSALSAWEAEARSATTGANVAGIAAIGIVSMLPVVGGVVGGGAQVLLPMMLGGAKSIATAGVQGAQSKQEVALAECRRRYLE